MWPLRDGRAGQAGQPRGEDSLREPAVPVLVGLRDDCATATATATVLRLRLHPAGRRATPALQRREVPEHQSHTESAIAGGWPRVLVVNRPGKGQRRERLLQNIPTKSGFDRDEYPPAVGRGRAYNNQRGLVRGADPIGWLADVMYVPSSENRSHGASLGNKLRRFCNGTRFRYAFG